MVLQHEITVLKVQSNRINENGKYIKYSFGLRGTKKK